jgi:hypothetical protein
MYFAWAFSNFPLVVFYICSDSASFDNGPVRKGLTDPLIVSQQAIGGGGPGEIFERTRADRAFPPEYRRKSALNEPELGVSGGICPSSRFRASEGRHDVAGMIENIVEDFLDRTKGDPHIWSEAHANSVAEEAADDSLVKFGNPGKGYRWQGLLLENGSQLKMPYGGKDHFAEVRHQQIYYEGSPCSPSQFASRVANNTSRNAWRDIWIKSPSDREFRLADNLRRASETGGRAVMTLVRG